MYRRQLVQCTSIIAGRFFPGALFPFFSTGREGNLFPGRRAGWLWPCLPLGPSSSSELGASWTEEKPSTWQKRRESQRGWKGQVKWHLHCQFLLDILSPSPLSKGDASWSSKQIKRSKHQHLCHPGVQYCFSSSSFCWTMLYLRLTGWFTEFTLSTTFPPVLYANNGSQALPTLVAFFSILFILSSGS